MIHDASVRDDRPDARRRLPSVNTLLELSGVRTFMERAPRASVVEAVRAAIEAARVSDGAPRDEAAWLAAVAGELSRIVRPSLRPVINATGVVLHTNLGRAPLADAAIDAMVAVARGYSNLEYDVESGTRGSRYAHCAALLRELTGAEDALVVNNGAAALVLALNTLARGRGAIISRGELVEIGGSFRIPDIMERSGASLVEIGTTNRTHVDDYRLALGASGAIGAVLKVHRSNFTIEGFVAEASVAELRPITQAAGVPIIHDLGSGLLISLDDFRLTGEPTARDALGAGATLVTMSGDKLLGGPQSGIILGERATIAALRHNPLVRSYRVDKLTLAALEATLALYRDPARAKRDVPVLGMLGATTETLRRRARSLCDDLTALARVEVVESEASVGGGAFPSARIPSVALAIGGDAGAIESALRLGEPAVIGRVSEGRLLLDLRTVAPRDDHALVAALLAVMRSRS